MSDVDPDYQDEVLARVAYAQAKRRSAVRRGAIWRRASRLATSLGVKQKCINEMKYEWQNVRFWLMVEQTTKAF